MLQPLGALAEGETFHLESYDVPGTFLDTCGGSTSGARNDVSTHKGAIREGETTTWSCWSYDDSEWQAVLAASEDVPPYTLKIHSIQCIVPSSGMAGAQIFGTAAGIIGAAIGTISGAAAIAASFPTTAGAATPGAIALTILMTAEMTAIGSLIGVGAQKAGTAVGTTLPDQVYLKVGANKVWPTSPFVNMNRGDQQNVNYVVPRPAEKEFTIEIYDPDVILADDLLHRYVVTANTELVNSLITVVNDVEASSYVLAITATGSRSGHDILRARHDEQMKGR